MGGVGLGQNGTGRVIALKGVSAYWDCNGDSLLERAKRSGRNFEPFHRKYRKRF